MQPRERTLHDPPRAPEPAAVAAVAVRNQRGDAALSELVAMPRRIVAAVALHHLGFAPGGTGAPADRRYRIDQVQQLRDVGPIGGGQRRDERNPVGVGKNMMLRPGLTAIGRVRSSFFPPRIARVHAELCVVVQLETRVALGNLEAIAAVDGVDGLFIGPSDLAADMGHVGNSAHPDVRAAIDDAITRIVKTGKFAGILAPVEADARRWMALGCLFVAVGSDVGILARQSEALAAKFKQ